MWRRKFIALLGGAVVLWPLAAHAQERMRRVGVLISGVSDPETQGRHRAFLEAMEHWAGLMAATCGLMCAGPEAASMALTNMRLSWWHSRRM